METQRYKVKSTFLCPISSGQITDRRTMAVFSFFFFSVGMRICGFGLTVPCLTVLYSWWMTISLLLLGALWSKHLLAGKLPLLGVKFNKYIKAIQCVIGWLASEDNQFCWGCIFRHFSSLRELKIMTKKGRESIWVI